MYKKVIPLLSIPVITLIIIFSWFHEGKIISNVSEENLDIFHSQKTAEHNSTFWYEPGVGSKNPFNISSYPMWVVLGGLEKVGIPPFARQAILLGSLMMVGMFSVYFLIRKGFNLEYPVALIGSILYLLNIFSMTQIWKRFIYTHITVWAYLPLFIFLWIKWIYTHKPIWLIIFLLSSLLFTNTFNNPVFLLTIWTPAFIFVLEQLWTERKKRKKVIYIFISSLVGFTLWSAVNFWWLYPTLNLGSSWTEQTGQTWQGDFDSLQAVSRSFPLLEVLLLRQSWYLGTGNDWNDFYHNPLIYLINIGVFLLMVYGVVKSKGFKFRNFLIILGSAGLFISKGTSFPFGYTFFHILFSKFPLTTALRNSYEKFGLVWLLPYAIFFAIGVYYFILKFKNKLRYIFGLFIMVLSCGLLVYPMWNGDIFPPKHRLTVPTYYIEANDYLNRKSSQKIFSIPFMLQLEKRVLSWGYIGEDPSHNLFDAVTVSPMFGYYSRFYKLFPDLIYNNQFPKILGLLGVSDIIIHNDSIYPEVDFPNVTGNINKWEGIDLQKEFGQLRVVSLNQKLVKPTVFAASSIIMSATPGDALAKILNNDMDMSSVFVLQNEMPSVISKLFVQPKLTFRKINNADYLIQVSQSKGDFILVLNESFDSSWKAKINSKLLSNHFIVNGFANGWIVDERGDFQIKVKFVFWPWD